VTEWPNFSFILVPQTDRRQRPDRRTLWRGSRRASDIMVHGEPLSGGTRVLWTVPSNEAGVSTAKP
jgi:hypothetical protein